MMSMSKEELITHAQNLFVDRYNSLNYEEIDLEILRYRRGTAPINPSFIVEQQQAHGKIKKIMVDFFTKQLGMEYNVLISEIGDGKTHILHYIHSQFSNIDNVFVNKIYLRDKESDIIQDIIKSVKRSSLRKIIESIVKNHLQNGNDKSIVVCNMVDELNIDYKLALLMWFVAYGDIEQSVEALNFLSAQITILSVLKSNDQLRNLKDPEGIYIDFLKLLCDYMYHNNYFIIALFDELEHVFDRPNKVKRKFFTNLKHLIDYSDTYRNIFILFANTDAVKGELFKKINDINNSLKIIDPALQDRLKSVLIHLESVRSKEEMNELVEKLKVRYCKLNKGFSMKSEEAVNLLINEKLKGAIEPSYRTTCQKIIEIFDENANKNVYTFNDEDEMVIDNINQIIEVKEESIDNRLDEIHNITNIMDKLKNEALSLWISDSAPAQKTKLITAFYNMFKYSNIKVNKPKLKQGYILAKGYNPNKGKQYRSERLYFFAYSTQKSDATLISNKIKEAENLKKELNLGQKELYFIYYKEICPSNIENKLNSLNPGMFIPISVEKAEIIELLLLNLSDEQFSLENKKELAQNYAKKFLIL